MCIVFGVGGYFPVTLFAFFVFLPRNEHFCAHGPRERQCATAHKPVCVRVICKGEGGECQNKKRLVE
jgi:hypothetical protein